MLVPISWLKDFVEIDIPVELLAERLTLAGLEVAHIHYIGVPQQQVDGVNWPTSDHLVWDREKLVLGAIREIKAHPDADRLVLAMVDYGGDALEQCVTGAPNLFAYKDQGKLETPLWTAFAHEGATVWDGHSDERKLMTLKGRKLRGIYNKSMVCSEKELGISEEHEGIILLDPRDDYVPGTPLQDVLGDVVLDIELTPNLARCFSILGVAREVAALLDKPLREPSYDVVAEGASIQGAVTLEIREPELNPRFTFALLRDTTTQPSPELMQRRLKLVGQRPINNIVDVTNYITFEIGQPLHAYDYDKLVARAAGKAPHIITRLAEAGEALETLDEVKRELDAHNILVCDEHGILGLGGVIGGAETEISDATHNVLLEAANWNFINIRRTMQSQKVFTDAGTRFSRGVHPSQAILGVQRGIELMRQTGGGQVAQGIIDEYPLQPETVHVDLPVSEVQRLLGMTFTVETAADILRRLLFDVEIDGDTLHVTVPDHRLDINSDAVIGQADLIEEIARIYGYDKIPSTIIGDDMPPQVGNPDLMLEDATRDLLAKLGLRETINYRFTSPEREALLIPDGMESSLPEGDYVVIRNPISSDKTVLRKTLLANLLETAQVNARFNTRQQLFEIGRVYLKRGDVLPDEVRQLAILLTGPRNASGWMDGNDNALMDFYDVKGVVEGLVAGLHLADVAYCRNDDPASRHTSFHPKRSALFYLGGERAGVFGELHPQVAQRFGLVDAPVLAGVFDLDKLFASVQDRHLVRELPTTPPILQDIAIVVDADVESAKLERVIAQAGGDLLKDIQLFDVYQGDPLPEGRKSLAYHLVYQTNDRTLKDKEVAKVHQRIIKTVQNRVAGAEVRM